MAAKKKRGGRTVVKTRAKAKAGTRKTKAGAKSKAKPKAKAKAVAKATPKTKAKAKAKAKTSARKPKRAPARKPAPIAAAAAEPSMSQSIPIIVDEVIEQSLVDVSTILRVKDKVARAQRDVDEDELKQFPDPSLVIEVESTGPPRPDDTEESYSDLPDLFAAEARRQEQRSRDPVAVAPKRREGSLFGLDEDAPDEGDAAPDDRDDD